MNLDTSPGRFRCDQKLRIHLQTFSDTMQMNAQSIRSRRFPDTLLLGEVGEEKPPRTRSAESASSFVSPNRSKSIYQSPRCQGLFEGNVISSGHSRLTGASTSKMSLRSMFPELKTGAGEK
jgi:hypothetical protein